MWRPTSVAATVPKIPSTITTPTTIRNVFKPLLVAAVEAVATGDAVAVAAGAAGTLIPHFLQKEAPGSRVAPQALQKAKGHLSRRNAGWNRAKYIANFLRMWRCLNGQINSNNRAPQYQD